MRLQQLDLVTRGRKTSMNPVFEFDKVFCKSDYIKKKVMHSKFISSTLNLIFFSKKKQTNHLQLQKS